MELSDTDIKPFIIDMKKKEKEKKLCVCRKNLFKIVFME